MIPAVIESKRIDGKPAHRMEGAPLGAWIVARSEIDAMFDRVRIKLGINQMAIHDGTGISAEGVSRCRHGKMQIPDHWLLRLSDFSGVPVAELRMVACVAPSVAPHPRAAK